MQTLTIGRSTYKLSPSRNVGELQAKLSKFTGKTKKTIIAKERRSYPIFKAGQSTSEYVNSFYGLNDLGALHMYGPLNTGPCTLYSGADLHEIIDAAPGAEIAPPAAPEPAPDVGVPEPASEAVAADPDLIRSAWNDAAPGAPVRIPLCAPTPLQYLPIFVRLAIEWIDSNSEMRNTQALDDMIDSYATTYGRAADDQERKSAHYLCARRFGNFLVIPADPAPTAPRPRVLYSEFIRSASKREAPMMV